MSIVQQHVVDALAELADDAAQRQLWTSDGRNGALVSSLTECTCRLFDDSGLVQALERGEPVYSESIDDRLKRLRGVLSRIDDGRAPETILTDPLLRFARDLAESLRSDLDERT